MTELDQKTAFDYVCPECKSGNIIIERTKKGDLAVCLNCEKIYKGSVKSKLAKEEAAGREKRLEKKSESLIDKIFDDRGKLKRRALAEHIIGRFDIKTFEDTDEILIYRKGIYKEAEPFLKSHIQRIIEGEEITTYEINEILNHIRRMSYENRKNFNSRDNVILENGILEFNPEIRIKEHSPEELATVKIPVKFNKKADCPKIKKFVSEIVSKEDIPVIQEMIGYCLFKKYLFAKAFMFLGEGNNGKSTLINLIKKFLGRDNVATPSLQEICFNQFAKVELYGKLANVHSDLPPIQLALTGNFKMLTGRDLIRGEKKHKQAFNFENYAKLIYSANELPRTKDTTKAFFRRWIIIKFPNVFEGENEDPNILKKISTEKELSGLLNWAIKGLKRILRKNGFSKTQSIKKIKTEWILRTDSLRAFVDKFVEAASKGVIVKKDFYHAYSSFCEEFDIPVEDPSVVGRKLPTIIPKVKPFRPKINGKRKTAWKGIKFVPTIKEYVKDVKVNSILYNNNENYNIKESLKDFDISDIDKNKSRVELVLSCYPEREPKDLFKIKQKAEEKGIKEQDFDKFHFEFSKKGWITNVRGDSWVRSDF